MGALAAGEKAEASRSPEQSPAARKEPSVPEVVPEAIAYRPNYESRDPAEEEEDMFLRRRKEKSQLSNLSLSKQSSKRRRAEEGGHVDPLLASKFFDKKRTLMIQKLNGSAVVNLGGDQTQFVMELRDEDKFHRLVKHPLEEVEEPEFDLGTAVPVTKEERSRLGDSQGIRGGKASKQKINALDSRELSFRAGGQQESRQPSKENSVSGKAAGAAKNATPRKGGGGLVLDQLDTDDPHVHLHVLNKNITQQSAQQLRSQGFFDRAYRGKQPGECENGFNSRVFGTNQPLRDILKPKNGVRVRNDRDDFGAGEYKSKNGNSMSLHEYREMYEP